MRLPFLLTLPRVLRHSAAIGADLPPDEAVVLDAPDAALRTALTSAAQGDHGPARELLAATREHTQWELRDGYVSRLAEAALHNPGWLDAWLDESPEDPDAVLVRADLCIDRAWEIRTAERAGHVSRDQFQAFFALLEDAAPVIGRAAELNPADPVPWRIALIHAVGSQAPREVFDGYWAQALARDPHHFGCHAAALQYLCAKWHGSHEEMFGFAESAADTAPPGSKLHALPLFAALEYAVLSPSPSPGAPTRPDPYALRVAAAVTRALDLSAAYEPGSHEAAGFRNHLALMLLRTERWDEGLEAFRGIGVHATKYPWAYFGDDPRQEFLETRSGVRIHVATRTPFFGRPPQPRTTPAWAPGAPCAVAIAVARPADVAQAALMCGVSLRTAPATATHTYVEAVPEARPAKRSVLSTEDPLTTAADNFTTGEKWPTLVLRRTPERCGFTLFLKGRPLAAHEWNATSPAPDHTTVTTTAEVLSRAFALTDPRPLVHILRSTGNPPRHQSDLLAALSLPPLPPGFGDRPEVLDTLPDARLLTRRGLLAGMRSTMTAQDGEHPSAPDSHEPRSLRWWLVRVLALLLFTASAVRGWLGPDVSPVGATVVTISALYVAARLTGAWRQRRRTCGGAAPAPE